MLIKPFTRVSTSTAEQGRAGKEEGGEGKDEEVTAISINDQQQEEREKAQRDTIENIIPSWIQKYDKALELHQQISAELLELERRVAEINNKKTSMIHDNFVSIDIKHWLNSSDVTDQASINKKRKELEEYAGIEK